MSAKKLTFVLICCLLVVLGTAVFALLEMYPETTVASADSEVRPSFLIATEDGRNWTLLLDNGQIAEYEGRFIDSANITQSVVRKMYDSMLSALESKGYDVNVEHFKVTDYCDIAFDLPSVESTVKANTAKYNSKGVFFEASITGVVSTPDIDFEYRIGGGEWRAASANPTTGGYLFGQGVSVGEYEVRLVATETISFEGIDFQAERYGNVATCEIEKADLPMPQNAQKSAVYGTQTKDIAKLLVLSDFADTHVEGRFSLSDFQTDSALIAADKESVYLGVCDGGHEVYFDFMPDNGNYNSLERIKVQITIAPRTLYVRIHDAYSLVGEDLIEPTYVIDSRLVAGDTEEDLGVRIENNADKNVASIDYRTDVVFSNPNYVAECRSFENQFANYGRYFVYAKRVEVKSEDGQTFDVYYGGGLVDVLIRVSLVEVENVFGKPIVGAYKFSFVDGYGNDLTPDGFTVSWQSVPSDVRYVAVCGDEEMYDVGIKSVTLTKENNVLCFLKEEPALTPVNIALIAICGALACAVVALCVVWKKQRRYLV